MKNLTIEFLGVARSVTGVRKFPLSVSDHFTYRDIVCLLAEMYPSLIGQVIAETGDTFIGSNLISRNGQQMIRSDKFHQQPADGDVLLVMSILAGG